MTKRTKKEFYGVFYKNHGKVYGPHRGNLFTSKAIAKEEAMYVAQDVQHKAFVRKLVKAQWANA